MHTTKYITDQERSFFEPELTILATKRIKTAIALKKKLSRLKNDPKNKHLIDEYIKQYQAADASHVWWEELLNES